MFSQTFGGAIFLTVAQTIFSNSLSVKIAEYLPNIDAGKVISAGATGMHDVVAEADLPGVLLAYADSVDHVFYLVTASGVLVFAVSWGMGWTDIREKKKPADPEAST